MTTAEPLTKAQVDPFRRLAREWEERADSHDENTVPAVQLRNCVADLTGLADVLTEPTPLEAASRNALEAWDALDVRTRRISTGIDFLTAMEAMRIEVFR